MPHKWVQTNESGNGVYKVMVFNQKNQSEFNLLNSFKPFKSIRGRQKRNGVERHDNYKT